MSLADPYRFVDDDDPKYGPRAIAYRKHETTSGRTARRVRALERNEEQLRVALSDLYLLNKRLDEFEVTLAQTDLLDTQYTSLQRRIANAETQIQAEEKKIQRLTREIATLSRRIHA